jgi:hypothetical protein
MHYTASEKEPGQEQYKDSKSLGHVVYRLNCVIGVVFADPSNLVHARNETAVAGRLD